MILLDTCALLWLSMEQSSLSEAAIEAIKSNKGFLYVSSISAFEVAIKVKKKKLKLKTAPLEWFKLLVELHGLKELPVTSDILITSVQLPEHHKDPCDRMIIATAKLNNLALLTADKEIKRYRSIKTIW